MVLPFALVDNGETGSTSFVQSSKHGNGTHTEQWISVILKFFENGQIGLQCLYSRYFKESKSRPINPNATEPVVQTQVNELFTLIDTAKSRLHRYDTGNHYISRHTLD
ncbi:uncharacterized protein KGF55_002102 [Candida pseudojiufengensis]|uniref:uncharacterized protein n=1 Tax=Candida pseudojiufengensis TaxID=497109 RepID=UPI002223FC90|nr:uncharacterized protein KGF55_002102 [Candida pseudojiufengensis]KAI5964160.1 hypothetical protein KGF55_002102 [Candida pseudojiufengensis]